MFDWILADQSDSATQILGSNLYVGKRSQWELIRDHELAAGDAGAVWYGASSKVDWHRCDFASCLAHQFRILINCIPNMTFARPFPLRISQAPGRV